MAAVRATGSGAAGQAGDPPPAARQPRADAQRNRRALVAAARRVFERDGFVRARITDIAGAAGVAHGSFYSHFVSKEDVLAAVLAEVEEEMLNPGPPAAGRGTDPAQIIGDANRAYLAAYRRNARMMALLEQVATVDPAFAEMRRRQTEAFVARNTRAIRSLQQAGLADPGLDPNLAALALSVMVGRTAYAAFVIRAGNPGTGHLADTLTRLWLNALRIPLPEHDAGVAERARD